MPLSIVSRRWLSYTLAALLVTFSLFTAFGDRGLLHLRRLSEEKRKLDERNFRLQRTNEALRERIYRLRHDNRYLEKIAREDLGLVRRGEIVYRFISTGSKKR
jgi:cell division protein FtsB